MAVTSEVLINPYLHIDENRIYNPLTDRAITPADAEWPRVRALLDGGQADESLVKSGWVVPEGQDLSRQYRLKIVSLETMTTCNQKCYFCPVSIAPRPDEEMPDAMFERIVNELTDYRETIEGVFLQSYNEPTIDRRFVDHCSTLFKAGFPVAVLSNGTGLTPARVDALMRAGTLRYLCINLSAMDSEEYARDRGGDHLALVLRNLEYFKNLPIAEQMRIIVLGRGDDDQRRNFELVRERFAGSRFEVESFVTIERAHFHLDVGQRSLEIKKKLAGCELMGSRPLQHLHITPRGTCVLCCQDYDQNYVVGDLNTSTIADVLAGDEMAKMRRWVYGVDEAPDDFICRTCVFALER
jgi:wyosine [tRNA(Phe)-imidazoG37] synthetase (radical SAM superfamily)